MNLRKEVYLIGIIYRSKMELQKCADIRLVAISKSKQRTVTNYMQLVSVTAHDITKIINKYKNNENINK